MIIVVEADETVIDMDHLIIYAYGFLQCNSHMNHDHVFSYFRLVA